MCAGKFPGYHKGYQNRQRLNNLGHPSRTLSELFLIAFILSDYVQTQTPGHLFEQGN